MFQAVYDSAWHHPGLALLAAALFALLLASRQTFVTAWAIVFLFEIAADALVTGQLSPVPKKTELEKWLGITFVVLGDFRYFLLAEVFVRARAAPRGLGPASAWGRAAVLAFVVPVLSVIPQKLWPDLFADTRKIFLLYEVMLLSLVVVLRFAVLPRRLAAVEPSVRRWILRVTTFVAVQYGLWATADVIILAGAQAGLLLRLVPNFLYYAAFVPFVFLSAPGSSKGT